MDRLMLFKGKVGLKNSWILALIIFAALALKLGLQLSGALPFNSDEAIVGLMARHIINLGEHPVFFYGQSYMGSLDAYLVALGFTLLGHKVWVIRLVQSLLYTGTLVTTFQLGKVIFGSTKVGLLAAGLLAIPAVNVSLYTTVSIGGYGEALLLGNLIILLALLENKSIQSYSGISDEKRKITWLMAAWGFLVGLGLWVNGLTIVYSLPAGLMIVFNLIRKWVANQHKDTKFYTGLLLLVLVGFLLGSAPWWFYALQNGVGKLLSELLGGAVAVESGSWVTRSLNHLLYFLLFGVTAVIGIRPPWDIRWLVLPLLPVMLVIWFWIIYSLVKKVKNDPKVRQNYLILMAVMAFVLAGFIFTPFGADPSGRYFLPFTVPLSLMVADLLLNIPLKFKALGPVIFILLIVYNLTGTIQCALTQPGLTTQFDAATVIDHRYDDSMMAFLRDRGEMTGYSNYWVAYPLAFLSDEEIIYTPRLPYHQDLRYTSRDDRYAPYDGIVSSSPKTAYITTSHNKLLDERLRQILTSKGIRWSEKQIGDYLIYYDLSVAITPLDLGITQ
jgi:4-amino-4-deoxy-L-arabinose transferase-like glycosyltransferase